MPVELATFLQCTLDLEELPNRPPLLPTVVSVSQAMIFLATRPAIWAEVETQGTNEGSNSGRATVNSW